MRGVKSKTLSIIYIHIFLSTGVKSSIPHNLEWTNPIQLLSCVYFWVFYAPRFFPKTFQFKAPNFFLHPYNFMTHAFLPSGLGFQKVNNGFMMKLYGFRKKSAQRSGPHKLSDRFNGPLECLAWLCNLTYYFAIIPLLFFSQHLFGYFVFFLKYFSNSRIVKFLLHLEIKFLKCYKILTILKIKFLN